MREKGETEGFDRIASSYDRWYETPLGRLVDRLEKEAVFGLLEEVGGGLALDLSCGTGNYTLDLARRDMRGVGVDLSEPMLRLAQAKARRAGVRLALVSADAGALPFRANTFDLVTFVLGLEFADPRRSLEEVHRVLKPGAQTLVAILNRTGLWTFWRRLKRFFVPSIWRHAAFLSRKELKGLLEARGFRALGWRGAVYFLPLFQTRGMRYLERWERWGGRWMPGRATFVAMAGRRA